MWLEQGGKQERGGREKKGALMGRWRSGCDMGGKEE